MIVIYTADVEKAENTLDVGCLRMEIEQGFLLKMNTKEIYDRLSEKIAAKELLTDEELMEVVVLPLTVKGKVAKVKLLKEALEMSKSISDEDQQKFVLLGMIVFADKITDDDMARRIKEMIGMTKVGRLFAEEMEERIKEEREKAETERQRAEAERQRAEAERQKVEAALIQAAEAEAKAKEEALARAEAEAKAKVKLMSAAIKLINEGMPSEKVMEILNITSDMLK